VFPESQLRKANCGGTPAQLPKKRHPLAAARRSHPSQVHIHHDSTRTRGMDLLAAAVSTHLHRSTRQPRNPFLFHVVRGGEVRKLRRQIRVEHPGIVRVDAKRIPAQTAGISGRASTRRWAGRGQKGGTTPEQQRDVRRPLAGEGHGISTPAAGLPFRPFRLQHAARCPPETSPLFSTFRALLDAYWRHVLEPATQSEDKTVIEAREGDTFWKLPLSPEARQ